MNVGKNASLRNYNFINKIVLVTQHFTGGNIFLLVAALCWLSYGLHSGEGQGYGSGQDKGSTKTKVTCFRVQCDFFTALSYKINLPIMLVPGTKNLMIYTCMLRGVAPEHL